MLHTTTELAQQLAAEGCRSDSYAIGERGSASDAFCLIFSDGLWRVFYTERGVDQAPFYESASEAEACEYFFGYIMRFRHDHCVGYFRSQTAANELQAELAQVGIASHQDKIPHKGAPCYRIFVVGKAVFAATEHLGTVPRRDM